MSQTLNYHSEPVEETQYPIPNTHSQISLDQILSQSPNIPLYGGGQWAIYSAACCWWTTFPSDLAPMPGTADAPLGPLPCCPHCHSVLLQAPLAKFIASAQARPSHYGPHGLDAFVAAHARNAPYCLSKWDGYNTLLDLADEDPDPRSLILAALYILDRDGLGVHYLRIAQETKLPLRDVARVLAQLELAGAVRSWSCERYALAGPQQSAHSADPCSGDPHDQ